MLRRPRALLAPLLVILLLAAGTSAVSAAPPPQRVATQTPASAVTDETCREVPVSAVAAAPRLSEPGGGSGRTDCWTVTPSTDGAHAFRFSTGGGYFRARLTLTSPDGETLLDGPWASDLPLATADLDAGSIYRVEVSRHGEGWDIKPYRLVVHDLSEGCVPLPEPRWQGGRTTLDVTGDRLGCGVLTTTTEGPLRLETVGTYESTALAVVDETGAAHCQDRYRSVGAPYGVVRCRSLPAGTYRVAVGATRPVDEPVELAAVPLSTTTDCTTMPLAAYGQPMPVSARRAEDGTGQECYSVTATTTGPHDLRGWQAADPLTWKASFEIWDVDAGELLVQDTDWSGVDHDPLTQPTSVELVAGRTYRVLVSGTPFVDAGTIVHRYDRRYRLGVLDRASTDGCAAVPTGWRDPTTLGRVEDGTVACHLVDLTTGDWARIDFRGDAALGHQVRGRLLDAEGRLVSDGGGTCRYRGGVVETPHAHGCRLGGPGPYRFVVHTGPTVDAADYTLRATDLTDGDGCRRMPYATWGQPLPVSDTLDPSGADCWTIDLPRDSFHAVSMAEDGGRWPERAVETYGADDGRPIWSHQESPAGTYRVVVAGDPGSTTGGYSLGVFDKRDTASDGPDLASSCPVLDSTSLAAEPTAGRTERGGYDCYRVPAGVDGAVFARMAAVEAGAPRASAGLRGGPRGWTECGVSSGNETRCDLERGSYRVLVSSQHDGPEATPYRFSLAQPTERDGCLSPRVASPDSDLLAVDLPAGGARTCVAFDDDDRQLLWSVDAPPDVRATVMDGEGDQICAYEPDEDGPEMCHYRLEDTDHPGPYTLVLTNTGTNDRSARLFLRSDPAAERGCSEAGWSDGNGPMPLLGRTDGGLDAECHVLLMKYGGVLLNRSNLDGAEPPDILVFDPAGDPTCSGYGVDPVRTTPECWTRGDDGRYVFWVLGGEDSAGRYRVDLGCANQRIGCAQAPPVDFTEATLRGPVTVGRTLRAGVKGVPPRGRVTWRWSVGDRVVRRTKVYTPRSADRGKRLRVQAVVTAPRYPRRVIRTPARTVRSR